MTKIRLTGLVAMVAGTGLIAACGNGNLLSGLGSNSSVSTESAAEQGAEQESSIHDMASHWCDTCPTPDGGATELSAKISPPTGGYTGGQLELALVLSDPAGVTDSAGNFRVGRVFTLNDFDFVAALPSQAWKVSADRTRVRVVVYGNLSSGSYLAEGKITDGSADAEDDATYTVSDDGGHEPTPTPEASPSGTHSEPSPTPTGDHSPTPTPTPGA